MDISMRRFVVVAFSGCLLLGGYLLLNGESDSQASQVKETGKAAADGATFASVVKAHYAEWTKGSSDKKLHAEQVAALVKNPMVRGERAMAIAAIQHYFQLKNAPKSVDESFLLKPKNADAQTKEADFQHYFVRYSDHLKNISHILFGKGAPDRHGLSQGSGDCCKVATVGAFVTHHGERLKSMIQEEKDHSYTVTFPNCKPLIVPPLTDAQIVLEGVDAGQQGLWLNVFMAAYYLDRSAKGRPEVARDQLGDGSCVPVIALLTGQSYQQIQRVFPATLAAKNKTEAEKTVEKLMQAVNDHKLLACASTDGKNAYNAPLPPGIAGDHAYGVIGYEPGKKLVRLWNPWGGNWEPKGSPGLANGYPRTDGAFAVPLSDFVVIYRGFEVQGLK